MSATVIQQFPFLAVVKATWHYPSTCTQFPCTSISCVSVRVNATVGRSSFEAKTETKNKLRQEAGNQKLELFRKTHSQSLGLKMVFDPLIQQQVSGSWRKQQQVSGS